MVASFSRKSSEEHMKNPNAVIYDKSTGQELDEVPFSPVEDVHRAVAGADRAFAGPWSGDALLRSTVLREWADALEGRTDALIDLLMAECGKVRRECEREVAMSIDALRFNAGIARAITGEAYSLHDGSVGHLTRQPVGASAFIVPWNWPLFLLMRDLAPALAAGVTAVVKPAPQTPLTIRAALELLPEAAPHDILTLVHGDAEVGQALIEDPRIRAVSFTGSTAVGRHVATTAASRFAKVMLELGGKGASVLFEDADLERAVDTSINNAFITAGQMCMANARILAHRSIAAQVQDMVVDRVRQLTVGHPGDPGSDIAALISDEHAQRVQRYLDLARADGHVLTGGRRIREDGLGGAFMEPAVISGESVNQRIVQEEIFGPVVTVEPFDNDDHAVRLANATPYGLAAALWTERSKRAWRVARELDFGTVWVNRYNRTFSEVPSGGMKESGMGRTRGFEGVHEFMELKHINWDLS
jgi:acyl-CoA reductase-like NAD-dependent aldehyde dehydrogenase